MRAFKVNACSSCGEMRIMKIVIIVGQCCTATHGFQTIFFSIGGGVIELSNEKYSNPEKINTAISFSGHFLQLNE